MSAPLCCIFSLFIVIFFAKVTTTPIVINTWPFTNATHSAYTVVYVEQKSALDAVEAGCLECEIQRCDGSVGPESNPDEKGETTLDAMIMDGKTMDVGSVGSLRNISSAIKVARAVMEYTDHTLLVGELATKFAVEMGFNMTDISSVNAYDMWKKWKQNNCQPNYRKNVSPDPKHNCGPYQPTNKRSNSQPKFTRQDKQIGYNNHDTIGMIVIDKDRNIGAGTTTNGMNHKVPGRVGDSPIVGAGSYAENGKGGAAATGDGDIMMRFLPSYKAVQLMGDGMDPMTAAASAIKPIIKFFPDFNGAIITINSNGQYGAACHGAGIGTFHYSVAAPPVGVQVKSVPCAACHGAGIGTFHYSVAAPPVGVQVKSVPCI